MVINDRLGCPTFSLYIAAKTFLAQTHLIPSLKNSRNFPFSFSFTRKKSKCLKKYFVNSTAVSNTCTEFPEHQKPSLLGQNSTTELVFQGRVNGDDFAFFRTGLRLVLKMAFASKYTLKNYLFFIYLSVKNTSSP